MHTTEPICYTFVSSFQPMKHPLMLMLGDDGLLRLFDVKLMKVVHEVKPGEH